MAKLRMAHASTHGARKPPVPKQTNCNYLIIYTPDNEDGDPEVEMRNVFNKFMCLKNNFVVVAN